MGRDGCQSEREIKLWSSRIPCSHHSRGEGWIRKEKCWVESESLRRAAHRGHSRGREPEWMGMLVLEQSSVCFCNTLD